MRRRPVARATAIHDAVACPAGRDARRAARWRLVGRVAAGRLLVICGVGRRGLRLALAGAGGASLGVRLRSLAGGRRTVFGDGGIGRVVEAVGRLGILRALLLGALAALGISLLVIGGAFLWYAAT